MDNCRQYLELHLSDILENTPEDEKDSNSILFNLAPILTPIIQEVVFFKHPGFKEEKEWRLCRKQVGINL